MISMSRSWLFLLMAFSFFPGRGIECLEGGEEKKAGQIELDRERGEIRFPSWFVQPTRVLEVFACHESGPVWETVLAFDSGGEEIYRALKALGMRGPEFWNVTSPNDLRLVGGDRAVVWLRYAVNGNVHEAPAEEILVEEGTGMRLFVRGFSFAAEPVEMGDPPTRRIPKAVEITIGGPRRQGAVFSMLYHANDLPEMVNWMPAPEIDPQQIPELESLVKAKIPCTLIIRRVKSEVELVELASKRESLSQRRAVREMQKPLAAKIDTQKKEFEKCIQEVRSLLDENERRADLNPQEREKFALRTRNLIAKGTRLAAEIRTLYFQLWDCEEKYKYGELKNSGHLKPEQRAWVEMAYRNGFRFELASAERRQEIAALAEGPPDSRERRALLQKAHQKEIEALQLERERRWAGFKLNSDIRLRLNDPKEDPFIRRLFRESELQALADMRRFRAQVESLWVDALELRRQAAGSLNEFQEEAERRRAAADARSQLAEVELHRVKLMEELRWKENPGQHSDSNPEEEKSRLQKQLQKTLKRIEELRGALEAKTGQGAGSGEEGPEDGKGKPLFPEDFP